MDELIKPNAHVALVHFPIALLVVGVAIEVFSFLGWRRSSLRLAGRWMILLGAAFGVPVAFSGLYALSDVYHATPNHEQLYYQFRAHLGSTSLAVLLALAVVTTWIGSSDRMRHILHWPAVLLLIGSVALTMYGAHLGGDLVYLHGAGVEASATIPENLTEPAEAPAEVATIAPTTVATTTMPSTSDSIGTKIANAAPPLQSHLILAGIAFALAVLSLGVSSRGMMERNFLRDRAAIGEERSAGEVIAASSEFSAARAYEQIHAGDSLEQIQGVRVAPVAVFATWFALATAAVGYWYLARESDASSFGEVWKQIADHSLNEGRFLTRRLLHVITGVSIAILPLVILGIARFIPRARIVWLVFTILLLAALTLQVWLGSLMMFDSTMAGGPVTRWSGE